MKISALIVLLSCALLSLCQPVQGAISVGDKPNLEFVSVEGAKVSLKALRGKIVVVDFWATWCGPCMAMAGEMVQMNTEYKPKGLQMIGVSLDSDKAALMNVAKQKSFAWPQYFDGLGWKNKVWLQWGESGIPFTVLIGPDGDVLWKGHPGGLKEEIDKAFKEHPPQLVDPKVMAEAQAQLVTAEKALTDGDASAAIKALSKIPADPKADKAFAAKYQAATTSVDAAAGKMLADVEPMIAQKQFSQAIDRLKELSNSLDATPVGKKAKTRLAEVLAMPGAKEALKKDVSDSKSTEALAVAEKLKASGKHELAYPRFRAIVRDFPGTATAKTAQASVTQYEKDPGFVKRVMEQEAGSKANGALSMARGYAKAGKSAPARAKYQSIIDEFPGTSFAKIAADEMKALPAE